MIKELLLISALTFTPVAMAETETPTEPTTEETTTTEEEDETKKKIEEFLSQYFNMTTVSNIMLVLGYVVVIIKAITAVKQAKKTSKLSNEELKNMVLSEIKKSVNEETSTILQPILNNIYKTCSNTDEVLKVLSRVMVLSQNNDKGQNSNAILDCIASLGVIDKEVINETRVSAEETKNEDAKALEETNKSVDKVIKETTIAKYDGTSI